MCFRDLPSAGARHRIVIPAGRQPIAADGCQGNQDARAAKKAASTGPVFIADRGRPEEVAPAYVFLASDGGRYMTGQVLHPNGGEIING
jgi:NAD(P)-dependent dehydrogenase (short-subunit alcohol dehydrogenase family)